MGKISKCFGYLLLGTTLSLISAILVLNYFYRPMTEGVLYLKNATGEAEILRETETSIPHVFASSERMAVFT